MSVSEHLFFDPGHPSPDEAARTVGEVLSLEVRGRRDRPAIAVPWPDGGDQVLACVLEGNDYTAFDPQPGVPEDFSIFDDFPLLFRMTLVPGDGTLETQQNAGREFFDRVVASELGWPLVLVHEFEILVATYDVERGVREFPPGTRSDGTDEHLWR